MHKTVINAWVPVELADKLDNMAKERGESLSSLLAGVLASFAGIEIPKADKRMDDVARALIKNALQKNRRVTVRELIELLADNGIKRKKTAVTEMRLSLRTDGGGAKYTDG
jgi:hypothetical protein